MVEPPVLILPSDCRVALEVEARAAWPAEACGLLVGCAARAAAPVEVVRLAPARNRAAPAVARSRFELDPADWFAAWSAAERDGLEVVGVWHSHPDGAAVPSPADAAAAWPGYAYLIAATAADRVHELRSWSATPLGSLVAQRIAAPSVRDPLR